MSGFFSTHSFNNGVMTTVEDMGDSVCLNCDYFLEWEGDPIRCRCGDHNDFKVQLRQAFNELLGGDKK